MLTYQCLAHNPARPLYSMGMKTKTDSIDLDPVIERFRARINHFGPHHYGVLWSDAEQQLQRFSTLFEVVSDLPKDAPLQLADFGCGYGAMFLWLKDQLESSPFYYTGYDLVAEMIETCHQTINDEHARFIHSAEMLEDADYVFVSGTFTLKCQVETRQWEGFVEKSLLQLWHKSSKGLAFNFLNDQRKEKDPELYYANAEHYEAFCQKNMSSLTRLRVNQKLNEFTLLVERESG